MLEHLANYVLLPMNLRTLGLDILDAVLDASLEESMAKRRKMSGKGSRRYFSATAAKTHYKNVKPRPQRGGIRL